MNSHRERLTACGLLGAFEQARRAQDSGMMKRILEQAQFTPLEIDSILWSKGDIGDAPTEEERKKQFWDAIVGRIGIAIVSGLILGGVFAYTSSGLGNTSHGSNKMGAAMADYRTPEDAYYRPFLWGFVIGAVGGLVTGALVYDPTTKNSAEK